MKLGKFEISLTKEGLIGNAKCLVFSSRWWFYHMHIGGDYKPYLRIRKFEIGNGWEHPNYKMLWKYRGKTYRY